MTLSSNGSMLGFWYDLTGVYTKVTGITRNLRPVWKFEHPKEESYLAYNGKNLMNEIISFCWFCVIIIGIKKTKNCG